MQKQRLERLRKLMANHGLPAFLITNAVNRRYMTGFTGSSGVVLITENKAILLTDFRYMTQAPQQAIGYEVIQHAPQPAETVRSLLEAQGIKKLGFEPNDLTYQACRTYTAHLGSIEWIPAEPLVEKLRMIKDASELAIIKDAAVLADQTFSHILSVLKPGLTEWDIALEIEMFVRRHGGQSTSFDTIVASGERSALPHGQASSRVLGVNEFVKMDYGAYVRGYCSDITRTVVLGTPTDKHKALYELVLEAQLTALSGIRPGMTGRQADEIARSFIAKHGYGDYFGHGLGHGIGLEIHESPRLSMTCDLVLEPGMTVTVEPGIYLPGFGGVRIEDDIVITETGIEVLTSAPKQLICL